MDKNTLVIWNPNAGSTKQAAAIRQKLINHPEVTIYEPASATDAQAKVKIACEQGTKLIVAAGGDGTVNSVINGLSTASNDVALGVLPLGTANDWCASLAVSNDPELAWETLQDRRVQAVDVIELETESQTTRFANIATGGNSHRVTEAITAEMKERWGALCYIRGAVSILNDLKSFDTTISIDGGEPQQFSAWNLLVANGKTSAGRVEVAPQARLNDGLLDLVIIQSGTLIDLADLSVRYLFDDYIESDQVIYRQARHIALKSHPPVRFSLDGDIVDEQPISFRCLPAALNVIVGEEFQSG